MLLIYQEYRMQQSTQAIIWCLQCSLSITVSCTNTRAMSNVIPTQSMCDWSVNGRGNGEWHYMVRIFKSWVPIDMCNFDDRLKITILVLPGWTAIRIPFLCGPFKYNGFLCTPTQRTHADDNSST